MAFKGLMPAVDLVAPRYGLDSGGTVVHHGENDEHWGAGFEQENNLCGIRGTTWIWCGTDAASELTGDEGESLERWEWVRPFLVQAEDSCDSPLSARRPETQKRLMNVLELLSIKGAERELWTGETYAEVGEESKALSRNATDVGSGSAKKALALVEDAMAECLPGVQGTIHMPPSVAIVLDASLQDIDGELWTLSGSRVIVGAGYAGQDPGPQIYGTGPAIAHFGPPRMITDDLAELGDVTHNKYLLRAERLVAVTFDGCCHVGASVTL